MTGTVKTVKSTKGFGFIVDGDGIEYFFHRSEFRGHWNDLISDFEDNQKISVKFELDNPGEKGPRACKVSRLDYPNQAV